MGCGKLLCLLSALLLSACAEASPGVLDVLIASVDSAVAEVALMRVHGKNEGRADSVEDSFTTESEGSKVPDYSSKN